ncbi:MAG: Peptidyl-tRNA hydrolase [Chlamydiae bacterium]|nr:Peptidyl-tRNA hydrolase [Chlamydiota bacterium]
MAETSEKQLIIAGLGNPGKKYEMTRHNMGYLVVQAFAHLFGLQLKEDKRFLAKVAKGRMQNVTVHLVLPTTYMNESGQSVRRVVDYYKLAAQDIAIVSDDVVLPFGEMRLRSQGTAGGHNGLKSVQRHLGTIHYTRLRMGIGREGEAGKELSDFVLDKFTKSELEQLPVFIGKGAQVLEQLLTDTVENVMNVVNVRKKDKIGKREEGSQAQSPDRRNKG